jgi:hypothetical protein
MSANQARSRGEVIVFHGLVTQVARQAAWLFTGMSLEAHWVRPIQFAAVFGQKVEVGLERRHAPFHGGGLALGLALLVNELVHVVHRDLAPRLRADPDKQAHIANIVCGGATIWKPPPQVLLKVLHAVEFVHGKPPFVCEKYTPYDELSIT